MALIDTHCHIQDDEYDYSLDSVLENAKNAGVEKMLCIGTDYRTSKLAVDLANKVSNVYAVVGIHPHETSKEQSSIENLVNNKKVIGIGEIGLDYYYMHSPKDVQTKLLKEQLKIALNYNLPVVFHVRESFDDFWDIYDHTIKLNHQLRGVIHSFTDNKTNLNKALSSGLYIGVNGISTFTKDNSQIEVFKSIPIDRILIETDSPYLTPAPFRGTINQPAYCKQIAEYWAKLLGVSLSEIEQNTTANAKKLFNI